MQELSKSPYKLKNAVTVEMPEYMVRNPHTLVRNEQGKLGLSKDIDFQKEIPKKKPLVSINTNQKFGYHKDTPFVIEDSRTGQAAMEFNKNTKAIFSIERNGKIMANHAISESASKTTIKGAATAA
jgi:hypothetical protein